MVLITHYTRQITRITHKWLYTEYTVLKIFSPFRILSNLRLSWKTEFALKFLTVLNILFVLRIFEQLALVLKNRVCPEFFHCVEIFLTFRIFEQHALALQTKFPWTFTLYWIYFLHSGFLSNLRLPWKIDCAWIHLYFFHSGFLSNLRLPW